VRPTHAVPTPASREPRPTVVVLGAGIAGLTAAHELVERGFDVTVYEPRMDERAEVGTAPPGAFPPVKLGGLAASQYSTVGPGAHGSRAELRPFPGRRGRPRPPEQAVAGEHGFRFFPAYYLHIWDLFQRIPLYQPTQQQTNGEVVWQPTSRTVMDNVRRVVTEGTTVEGKPSLIFPREAPRTLAEMLTAANQLAELGFTVSDVQTFISRLLRYLVTSPLRRASELQNLSAYDFFIGRDATAARRFYYSPRFEALILEMPKVLAAFDSRWGDARTNITTYLQLQLQMDRNDNKADGVLNGPTTESWFDHWYRHLVELGVRFVQGAANRLEPPASDRLRPPHLRSRVDVVLADGTRLAPDYVVVAVDAPTAERITWALREAGTGGAVAGLDGFTTSVPPPTGPLQPEATRPTARRDPYVMDEMGREPWDRFQTLAGIQYYFDTEFQLVRGHVYYTGTEWGLSSINQHGLWERRPILARDGHVSVLSVDIGDFNTPSRHLVDELGRGKAARDCTADELAVEVWRQIVAAITSNVDNVPEALIPWPVWYALDRYLVMAGGPGQGEGRPVRNEAPYLIPIVGDWPNRPGGEPWNPHGSSWITRPTEDRWLEDLERCDVWQARHGGYQVHHNSLVFAGTWTKTFTRMTSMEAACESARHAVNAILDHYVWVETDGADRRENTTLRWRFPFGFLDQGFSSPVRLPSPAGDYCFVFDIENREPLDTRSLRNLDSQHYRASLPHPLDTTGPPVAGVPVSPVPPLPGGPPMTTSPNDYTGQLLTYLQAWRQYLEQATSGPAPGQPGPTAPWPILPMPPVSPPGPPMPPVAAPAGPLSPSSAPAPPPGDAVPPTPTYESRAYRRAETSGADGERSVQEADQPSLYDSRLTKLPPGPVPDRRPGSAYPWAGGPTSSGTPATAAARPLYSSPATSSGTPATAAQPLYSSPATSSPRPALGVETVAPNDDESSFLRPRPIPGRFPSRPEERGGTDGVEITGADPQA
jgi:uncharacterized protein with NAD-binding domain and iron-sulfur cluster